MQRAWSVLREARLSPYTYFYDHAPVGWITMAGWVAPCPAAFRDLRQRDQHRPGPDAAGAPRVRRSAVRSSGGCPAALAATFLAAFFFNFSPLAVYYQRQVLLDNLMMLWVLLGLYVLPRRRPRSSPRWAAGSGVRPGPGDQGERASSSCPAARTCSTGRSSAQPNRRFGVSASGGSPRSAPVGAYLLFAQIKNELFPAGLQLQPRRDHPRRPRVAALHRVVAAAPQLQQQQRPVVHHPAAGQLAVQGPLPAHRRHCRDVLGLFAGDATSGCAARCWPAR